MLGLSVLAELPVSVTLIDLHSGNVAFQNATSIRCSTKLPSDRLRFFHIVSSHLALIT